MALNNRDLPNLNRGLVALQFPSNPRMNITAAEMARDMLTLSNNSDFDTPIELAAALIHSPELYVVRAISVAFAKTSPILAEWEKTIERNVVIGDAVVFTDYTGGKKTIKNVAITTHDPIKYSGQTGDIVFTLVGYEPKNKDLTGD